MFHNSGVPVDLGLTPPNECGILHVSGISGVINNKVNKMTKEEKATQMIEVLEEKSLRELASLIVRYSNDYDEAKRVASAINEELDTIKKYTAERMDREGVQNATFPDIGRLGIAPIVRASVKADQKQGAYSWLQDHGHGDLITTTVNASSLAALIRREIKAGNEVPEDIFNVMQYDVATVTKS